MAASDYSTVAQELYVAYFGRAADHYGLAAIENQLDAAHAPTDWIGLNNAYSTNTTVKAIIDSFGTSHESSVLYAGSDSAFITAIFQNLFNRDPLIAGLDYWVGRLNSTGTDHMTRAQAATSIAAGASTADAAIIAQKVVIGNNITTGMDTAAEINAYSGAAAAQAIRDVLHTVDASTVATTFQATVDTAIAALVTKAIPTVTTALTAGVDTLVGGSGNDVFNSSYDLTAAAHTLSGLDSIDGGAGTNTLNIISPLTNLVDVSLAGSVTNIQNVNVTTVGKLVGEAADISAWGGVTAATFKTASAAGETITVSGTTALTVTNSTGFGVTTAGGSSVTVTNGAGAVVIAGKAVATASVTGGTTVGVTDSSTKGNVLTTLTVDGATAGVTTTTTKALTTVNLANLAGNTVTIGNATASHTQTLSLDTVTGATIVDAAATTVNVHSNVASDATLTIAAATSLAITATDDFTLNGGTFTALTAVTVAGAGAMSTTAALGAAVTVDASASTGANSFTLAAGQSYKGGSGVDTVSEVAVSTVAVDGGAGTSDVFVMNAASFALTKVTGFEVLGLGTGATGAYSAAGFSHLTEGTVTAGVTWNTVAAGTDLTITGSVGQTTAYTLATDTATDTLNLTLKSAAAIAGNTVTATNVETVNITATDTNTTKHQDTLTLASGTTNAMTIKVSGNAGLALTDTTDTTITSVDASAMTNTAGTANTGFTWTSGVLNTAAVTIKGSTTGGDNINASAATKAVTITEVAGANTIVGSATKASVLTGGTGVDTITGGSAADTIVGGGGADVIVGGAGADTITLSGATAGITQASGASGTNSSNIIQTAELTSTFDVVYGAAKGDTITLGNASIVAGNFTAAATNLAGGLAVNDLGFVARGTYDSAAGTFTYAANGNDSVLTYSHAAGTAVYESIILVGYHGTAADVAGVVTLG